MVNNIKIALFFSLMWLSTGCSSIRLAVYDYQKRHDYAMESKAVFLKSPVAKEMSVKAAIHQEANKYIGTPYRYGSCDSGKGFDCSGLVYTVAKSQDLTLPRSSSQMAASGPHIPWKKAEPGDLVFFGDNNRINHVGIVDKVKGDQIWVIHSTTSSGVVKENVLASDYWKKRILFAMDVVSPSQIKS
jgi:cell wall-associated NlpC family hydrolase